MIGRATKDDCIIAHQSGSQSTTCPFFVRHSTEPHCRQQFVTSSVLYLSLFHHLTGITTKTVRFEPWSDPDTFKYIFIIFFYVLLTVHLSIFISIINQLDAQNFCFTVGLFHASTCFEHTCSSSGGQNCITQDLVSSHLWVAVSCTGAPVIPDAVLI